MTSSGRLLIAVLLSASVHAEDLPPGCGVGERSVANDPPGFNIGSDHPDRYGAYQVRAYAPYYGQWYVQPTWMVYNHDQGFWIHWAELKPRKDGELWDYPTVWTIQEEIE